MKEKEILFYIREEPYGWLSNFERTPFEVDGKIYPTNEHYYQSQKAIDSEVRAWIRNAPNPYLAMKAGRSLRRQEFRTDWDSVKAFYMLRGLRAKFVLNPELLKKLLATGNATLHEDSPTDMFWGIKGKDMLGKLLMKVRAELRD